MLINKIREDMITARKGSDGVAKSLMVTLYSEAVMVGKNKRNGDSTDEEVISVVRKFIANAEDTSRMLTERGQTADVQRQEIEILSCYVPQQMDQEKLTSVIQEIVKSLNLSGPRAMGSVMAELKRQHTGCYDGRLASELAKTLLS
jgi:uncharacterized protein YqeY